MTVTTYMINGIEAENYSRSELPEREKQRLDYLFERSDCDPDTIVTVTEIEENA